MQPNKKSVNPTPNKRMKPPAGGTGQSNKLNDKDKKSG